MNCKLAKQINLTDLLEKLGYTPTKTTRIDWWYLSPFREEKTASFKVNIDKNVFYDHAEGFGGTTLDFVMKYNNCDVKSALEILKSGSFSFHQPIIEASKIIIKPTYTIQANKALTHPNLIQYIIERNLSIKMAQIYCKEVHYTLNNKSYYAVGFQNEEGGFELRNKYVKMCIGKKAVTYFDNKRKDIALFESWSDYISFLTLYPNTEKQYDFLILNSVSMLNNKIIKTPNNYLYESMKKIKYERIICCFDNDKAGEKAFQKLTQTYMNVVDGRKLYENHKDLNEFLITNQNAIIYQDVPLCPHGNLALAPDGRKRDNAKRR